METGYLNKYFSGVIVKKLSEVEANIESSNQHELNGNKAMRQILGTDIQRREFDTTFLYMEDDFTIDASGKMTWYDSRYNNPKRTEWRFYFPTTEVSKRAKAGDSLFICKRTDDTLLIIIAKKDSTIENQLYWLFDLNEEDAERFIGKTEFSSGDKQIEFAVRMILEQIGIEYEDRSIESYLEPMLIEFHGNFPTTREFSAYARNTITDADPVENPDDTLLKWVNREEALFKLLEQYLIKERIRQGFNVGEDVDVDAFIQFSLSVQNRRKSRAGLSEGTGTEPCFRRLLKEERFEEAEELFESLRPLEQKQLANFKKEQDTFVRIDWYGNVLYPHEILLKNIRLLEDAIEDLEKAEVSKALGRLYQVDNNAYAFMFDEDVYNHFTDYVFHQPRERLKWGYGRIMEHEKLYTLVRSLLEKEKTAGSDFESEILRLKKVCEKQYTLLEKYTDKITEVLKETYLN